MDEAEKRDSLNAQNEERQIRHKAASVLLRLRKTNTKNRQKGMLGEYYH